MKAHGATDIGMERSVNQDFVFCKSEPVGNLPNLFIVADGMGGHKAGDVASRSAVTTFIEYVLSTKDTNPITIMDEGIRLANATLIQKAAANPDYAGMGTTMVISVVTEDHIYIANVGDSRLYLIDDSIRQITRDHSLVAEMVSMGELNKTSARHHSKKNIITRAVGGEKNVIPDFFEVEYNHGDRILMCSDGLTNMVDEAVIRQIVLNNPNVEDAVDGLVAEANRNGGKDNISVILVQTQYDSM